MSKSTPTPWATDPDDRDGMEWNIFIVRADDREARIAFMTSDGPSEANAALIVRAVNSHAASLQAIRLARVALEHDVPSSCWATGPNTGDPIEDLVVCPGCRALHYIETALRLAAPADGGADHGDEDRRGLA